MSLQLPADKEQYLKIVVKFDSTATLQQVIDAWTTSPGPSPTGEEQFATSLQGYLNANYVNPVIVITRSFINEFSPVGSGRFELYNKARYTFDSPQAGDRSASKDAQLNSLKGVYNAVLLPPPVSLSNTLFHIHKSTGSVNET